jgi:hypothetical protein
MILTSCVPSWLLDGAAPAGDPAGLGRGLTCACGHRDYAPGWITVAMHEGNVPLRRCAAGSCSLRDERAGGGRRASVRIVHGGSPPLDPDAHVGDILLRDLHHGLAGPAMLATEA